MQYRHWKLHRSPNSARKPTPGIIIRGVPHREVPQKCVRGRASGATLRSVDVLRVFCSRLYKQGVLISQRQSITQKGVHAHPLTAREREHWFLQHVSHFIPLNFGRQQREHPFVRYFGALPFETYQDRFEYVYLHLGYANARLRCVWKRIPRDAPLCGTHLMTIPAPLTDQPVQAPFLKREKPLRKFSIDPQQIVKVARLQSEFCTKDFSREKCSELFSEIFEPLFCGSEKIPENSLQISH